jgi:acyl-CoA synthetase (AMP-forming)/AMP-acid ligase II
MLSLVHVVEWRAAVNPDQIALTDDRGSELAYADLLTAMEASAAAFAAAGVGPGDVVPIVARNQTGWVTAMLGLIRVGALPAAVNWRLAAPEMTTLLELMAPAAVVTDDDCAATATAANAALDVRVPVLTGLGAMTANGSRVQPPQRPLDRLRGHEPAILVHTSGTTGRPKLVPLTHDQFITAVTFMSLEVPEADLIEIVYGASPIRPDVLERAVTVLGCRFRQNYASSETGPLPISSLSPPDHDPARGRLATAGRPSLGWEVRLGERGEIQVRGAAPLPGYWNDPEATAGALTPDGFYRTGDAGIADPGGYITIVDRLNDVVITGGENVFPAEVEMVLAGHPAVADIAVIGIPDDKWGETVHAIVVAGPGLDGRELLDWARERLAGFKCPTGITVVSELPRNATGKVRRAQLREPFWAGRSRAVS